MASPESRDGYWAWSEHQHRSHYEGEGGGVDLNSDNSKQNLSRESHGQQVSAEGSVLTPELNGFIERVLVPLLVQRYIEKMKE